MSAASFSRYQAGGTPSQSPSEYDPKASPPEMPMTRSDHARRIVFNYVRDHLDEADKALFTEGDVFVVWFAYILGNWKALVSTSLPDGMYYEVTHNSSRQATFLDAYKKFDNVAYPDTAQDLV